MLLRISARHFCAGVVTDDEGYVTKAAPIVKYMRGWSTPQVRAYCEKHGWKLEELPA